MVTIGALRYKPSSATANFYGLAPSGPNVILSLVPVATATLFGSLNRRRVAGSSLGSHLAELHKAHWLRKQRQPHPLPPCRNLSWVIQTESGQRSPTSCCNPEQFAAVERDLEMMFPAILAWVEKPGHFAGHRILPVDVRSFVKIASAA